MKFKPCLLSRVPFNEAMTDYVRAASKGRVSIAEAALEFDVRMYRLTLRNASGKRADTLISKDRLDDAPATASTRTEIRRELFRGIQKLVPDII